MNTEDKNMITKKQELEDHEKIEKIDIDKKDILLYQIAYFNEESDLINTICGNINNVFQVFILSDDFKKLTDYRKREVLKSFDALRILINEIDDFCVKEGLGQYNGINYKSGNK